MIPEKLYQLLDRDVGQPWAAIFVPARQSTAAAAAQLNLTTPLDPRRITVLKAMTWDVTPGAGQTLQFLIGFISNPSGTIISRFFVQEFPAAAATRRGARWDGEIMIPPGWSIGTNATFDAGGVANTINAVDCVGFTFPQGTIQLP